MICQSCNGVIGRDCFNPEECMAITRDMADRYREQSQQASNCEQCEAALVQCQGEIQLLRERIEAMNAVFGKIQMTVGGANSESFQHGPWLPCSLMLDIDRVMNQEHRE